MRRIVAGVALVIAGFSSGCAGRHASVQQVGSAGELKSKMDQGGVMVVHALDSENYAKGHVPGATNIDYEKMTPDMLPKDKTQPMVFYCAGGMCPVGRMAANKAAEWGYVSVWVYEGGMKDWRGAGMTVATGK